MFRLLLRISTCRPTTTVKTPLHASIKYYAFLLTNKYCNNKHVNMYEYDNIITVLEVNNTCINLNRHSTKVLQ